MMPETPSSLPSLGLNRLLLLFTGEDKAHPWQPAEAEPVLQTPSCRGSRGDGCKWFPAEANNIFCFSPSRYQHREFQLQQVVCQSPVPGRRVLL